MSKSMNKKDKKTDVRFIEHDHLDKVGEIAFHYGFHPSKSPEIKKIDLEHSKALLEGDFIDDREQHNHLPLHVEEKVALLRMYTENNMQNMPQPVMFYFKDPFKKQSQVVSTLKKIGTSYPRYADLEIIGASKSIAEATLIHTARAMLADEGFKNISVEINSIGDKDSIAKFTRDLTAYYRKNLNEMHAECRQLLKKDPFALLSCTDEKCRKINDDAPKSVTFLTEASRNHFKEVLEYLETLGIPYRINNNLISNRKYCTETIFTIIDEDRANGTAKTGHTVLAIGVRYDGLAKKIGMKREIQGVGLSLLIKGNHTDLRKEVKKTRRPQISFVQLGFESKLLSLGVLELLREAKIPIYQSLAKDRLGAQVSMIEKNHIPYTIIMGQKEALEKSVIVRDTETHAQNSVSLCDLADYMKKLVK
jgi:histidyl-tRNA synthetase